MIQLISYALVTRLVVTQIELTLLLIALVTPLVLIASDILHRVVERPIVRLGARLAQGGPRTATA